MKIRWNRWHTQALAALSGVAVFTSLAVGAWAFVAQRDQERTLRTRAETLARVAAADLTDRLHGLHATLALFVEGERLYLEAALERARTGDTSGARDLLDERARAVWPQAAAFALIDPRQGLRAGAMLGEFPANGTSTAPAQTLGDEGLLLLTPMRTTGGETLLGALVMERNFMNRWLGDRAGYGFRLLLVDHAGTGGPFAAGLVPGDDATLALLRHSREETALATTTRVPDTGWELVAFPDPPTLATLRDTLRLRAAGLWAFLTACIAATAWWQLRRQTRLLEQCEELVDKNRNLEQLSLHDPLTGLANRALFDERFDRIVRAGERSGAHAALLLVDLDRFKRINDALGHPWGDRLLRAIGERLSELLRDTDTVARLGGDEFAVLAAVHSPEEAAAVASKVLDQFERPFEIDNLSIRIKASIGAAIFPQHGRDAAQLMEHADIAMYRAKQQGSHFAIWQKDHDPERFDRLALLGRLREGIARGEFELHYQPKLRLPDRSLAGAEALVRWRHPTHGLLLPQDFITLAEQSDAIDLLTDRILRLALDALAQWRARGQSIRVAVNLPPRMLSEERLAERIGRLLEEWGIGAEQLQIEITESGMMRDPERAIATLKALRDLGLRLSIDDFGTGHAALEQLKRIPADEIKIDKGFVIGMARNKADLAIVRWTIALAHDLGFEVVAEGVESAAVATQLAELGCDQIQGTHIGAPMDRYAFGEWLKTRS